MKLSIFLIPLIFSSCTLVPEPDINLRVKSMEAEIMTLKAENADLRNENTLLKAGGVAAPAEIVGKLEDVFPPGSTFEEVDNSACVTKANTAFMEAGNAECERLGYSKEEINTGSCTLSKEFIDTIVKQKEEALIRCGPM